MVCGTGYEVKKEMQKFSFGKMLLLFKESKIKKSKGFKIPNIPISFDIETTHLKDGTSFMYLWGFTFGDDKENALIVTGRTWEQFQDFIKELLDFLTDNKYKINVFVQNINFEFSFMFEFIKVYITKFFAKGERDVFYFVLSDTIKFRCLAKMTRLRLSQACIIYNTPEQKRSGFDYKKIRTPGTPLDESEREYFEIDLLTVNQIVVNFKNLKGYDHIDNLPITLTAGTRQKLRKNCNNKDYHARFCTLKIDNEIYTLAEDNMKSGANEIGFGTKNKIFTNIKMADFVSQYIYIMLCEYFPISRFRRQDGVLTLENVKDDIINKCCLFDCVLDVKLKQEKHNFGIIAISHILNYKDAKIESVIDNRIICGENIHLSLNEIDFLNILNFYEVKNIKIFNFYTAYRGELPPEIKSTIYEIYKEKVDLSKFKGTENQFFYDNKKQELNCIAGMIETKPIRDEFVLKKDGTALKISKDNSERDYILRQWHKQKGNYIYYPWGCWIISHGRKMVYDLIECAKDHIYHDTDSCYALNFNMEKLKELNQSIEENARNHDVNLGRLGQAVLNDEPIEEFKILNMKNYAEKINGKIKITVAGVPKSAADQLEDLETFTYNFKFKDVAKTAIYRSEPIHKIIVSGEEITTAGYCTINDRDFELTDTDGLANKLKRYVNIEERF